MDDYDREEWEPAPIDSYDLYAMGLRAPRCNGCECEKLQWALGDKCLLLREQSGTAVYELDAQPRRGQGPRQVYEGRSVRFHRWFMSTGHSDECYHWTPTREKTNEEAVDKILGRSKSVQRRLAVQKSLIDTAFDRSEPLLWHDDKPKGILATIRAKLAHWALIWYNRSR